MNEPRWIGINEAVELNRQIVAGTGEPHFVRDQALLESALAKPMHHWHYGEEDIASLAAALLLGIARNHPFEQGNKRTAFEAADAFLYLNGFELGLPDHTEIADLIVDVITSAAEETVLVATIAEHLESL